MEPIVTENLRRERENFFLQVIRLLLAGLNLFGTNETGDLVPCDLRSLWNFVCERQAPFSADQTVRRAYTRAKKQTKQNRTKQNKSETVEKKKRK